MTRIDPGMPNVIVEHGNEAYLRADGKVTVAPHVIADEETWQQMREGYRCVRCFQVQSVPFPERCEFTVEFEGRSWQCEMRIRDDQLAELDRGYRGSGDFEAPDPYEVLDVERDDWRPTKTGILVPGDGYSS